MVARTRVKQDRWRSYLTQEEKQVLVFKEVRLREVKTEAKRKRMEIELSIMDLVQVAKARMEIR